MKRFIATPSHEVFGDLRVPSDKSMSHRAVLLAAMARGTTTIKNPLLSEDVLATIAAVRACGAEVSAPQEQDGNNKTIRISSGGTLTAPAGPIDCGNSGTLIRLFCGAAAGQNTACQLIGDESLSKRPMQRVATPLAQMGARITTAPDGTPPVTIAAGDSPLTGITFTNELASAQVKSALLLAGLYARGRTVISEPVQSRDHTERMLPLFGGELSATPQQVEIAGEQTLTAADLVEIPADMSSAFFFLVAAAISPGSQLTLHEVGTNPTRSGGLELLMRMGADIDVENRRQLGGEEVADITVRGGYLHGIEITGESVPAAIDDFPALFVAAACARGQTTLSGAEELRTKESDRIAAMARGLSALGVHCAEKPDGLAVDGSGSKGKPVPVFRGGEVDSFGDHRIAMALSVASLRAEGDIIVSNCDNVATSFPQFHKLANTVGIRLVCEDLP